MNYGSGRPYGGGSWSNTSELLRVLDTYSKWRASGCSEREMTRRIQSQFGAPGFRPVRRPAGKYDALSDIVRNNGQ